MTIFFLLNLKSPCPCITSTGPKHFPLVKYNKYKYTFLLFEFCVVFFAKKPPPLFACHFVPSLKLNLFGSYITNLCPFCISIMKFWIKLTIISIQAQLNILGAHCKLQTSVRSVVLCLFQL